MPAYETPGVYWEERDATPPTIDVARMDVVGLVGIARKGPLDTPLPVESLRQFEAHFGSFTGAGYLAYAIKGFFDNGGKRAWVVRIASRDTARAAKAASIYLALPPIPGLPDAPKAWRVSASSPGSWGNALEVELRPGRRVAVTSEAAGSTPEALRVPSMAGFTRDSLVRVTSPGGPSELRVVALVDARAGLLHFVHPEPLAQTASDLPLAALDPGQSLLVEALSYSILVREAGRLVGIAADLSLVPSHPRFGPSVLALPDYAATVQSLEPLRPPFPVLLEPTAEPAAAIPIDPLPSGFLPLTGASDGLAELAVVDFIGEPFPVANGLTVRRRGLQCFERVPEPAALAIPDILIRPSAEPVFEPLPPKPVDPCAPCPAPAPIAALRPRPLGELPPVFSDGQILQVQQALVEHCELRRDRMALLDPPFGAVSGGSVGIVAVMAWRQQFDTRYAALYAPWLLVADPLRTSELRAIPACGHVAGQYALADELEGVHRAPANRDLAWAEAATLPIRDAEHGLLNTLGVDVIRPALGRALRILGARTVSSDPVARYVPVRRLVMMLIRSFERATQWAVFEPNDHLTRSNLAFGFANFLSRLWQGGALVGATPDAAFAVQCDETNNPPEGRDNGRLVCDIAIAPVDPLEFVILRIGRVGSELEIEERSARLQQELAS
jgi:phage tail sheath protein FI